MIVLEENISLKPFNTFGIDHSARYYGAFNSVTELEGIIADGPHLPILFLGGGSNILLTKDFEGIVLKNKIAGIESVRETQNEIFIKAGAAESWHGLVMYAVDNNYGGLENLSLIPGNVGASPMQNIGAYGVEIKDVFYELEAYDLQEKKITTFSNKDCGFGYRESVFKTKYKGRFVILNVTYCLKKQPVFNTSYGAIEAELHKMNVNKLSVKSISDAVIRIRQSKLPDPAVIGNAGSFFKNPVVDHLQYIELKQKFSNIPSFELPDGTYKIPAAWLIENTGWKGFRKGDAGCHSLQPLVLVNYGKAKGNEILELANEIIISVHKKFHIKLEMEVNVI